MTTDNRDIPAELRRAVLVEAGHRCAIPQCRQTPVDVHHIVDWAEAREHTFENLIVLCPTCHRRAGKGGDIDRKAMKQYKANLAIINGRYSDLERRILEACAEDPDANSSFVVPAAMRILLRDLVRDGIIWEFFKSFGPTGPLEARRLSSIPEYETFSLYRFTEPGLELVRRLRDARSLD